MVILCYIVWSKNRDLPLLTRAARTAENRIFATWSRRLDKPPDKEMTQIQQYLETRAASKIASDRAYARRGEIAKETGVNLSDAQDHPEYKALDAEASRLYWEADALTPHVIRANLETLGIADMTVTGVLKTRDGTVLGELELPLSDLCGLRYRGVATKLGIVDLQDVGFRIIVRKDGEDIGHIDSDGDFDFEAAPDLRTALGWKIATDGGRVHLIEGFDLDAASSKILETVMVFGTSREVFFNLYFSALKRIFMYEKTSRFSDGYCGAATVLWRVATKQLGKPHDGYPFCY